jgi:hypothetical protein
MQFLHAKRLGALWRGVHALLDSRKLWLTAIGRSWPTPAKRKHAIKAADRLLGSSVIHSERFRIASATAATILPRGTTRPLILVDTMEIRHNVVAFTASVAHCGRALPIWSTTIRGLRANAEHCRRFLAELAQVLPQNIEPILVTDGGFERDWFDEVVKKGWHYVGRVRGATKFAYRGQILDCQGLHRLATARDKDLGLASFPTRHKARTRRLVVSKLPTSGHRRRKTRTGNDNDSNYLHYRKNAHEPLLLTTSLMLGASRVVAIYKRRMQIEQSFRDLKNHRWGWSLRHCLTRSRARLEVLLLVAAVAMLAQHLVGLAAESCGLHRQHQANTTSSRRVLSFFYLGGLVLRDDHDISAKALSAARRKLTSKIDHLWTAR